MLSKIVCAAPGAPERSQPPLFTQLVFQNAQIHNYLLHLVILHVVHNYCSRSLVRRCYSLWHFAPFSFALLCFAPCMDMHEFTLAYIYIYAQWRVLVPGSSHSPGMCKAEGCIRREATIDQHNDTWTKSAISPRRNVRFCILAKSMLNICCVFSLRQSNHIA